MTTIIWMAVPLALPSLHLSIVHSQHCTMKAIVVLAILVGVSLAAPISTLYKLEERVFSSKDYFEKYLKMMHSSLDDYKDVIIPKDIYEFLKTLTVDDYEPMKMVNQIDIGDMYEMILRSHVIKTLYPDFHKRWETAGIGFLHSLQKLPTSTKNRVVNMFSLAAHIKSDNAKLGEVALKYYLSWPKENKDDLDEVFPRLSSEVEKVVAITGEDEPFKLPEGTDCSVEGKKTSVCMFFSLLLKKIFRVMKWILFISLFGVALASEFAINRPLKAAISRDEFARSLEALNTIVDVVEGKYIPDEIVTIIRSLKVDDYEALEYVRLSNFTLSEELIYDFKELFPHVYNLFLHEGGKLYSRIKELSNSTRDLCVEFTKAQAAFQEVEPVMYLKMIATTFLSWPLENQREFDTIVPGFSNLLKTYLPFFDALLMADSASSKEDLDRNAEPIESFSYRLNRFEEL
ncbi:hypothetical protein QR680_013807 [Steinernema hermaphroditum]|uniref:Fatty-acid and retinol-binding protein 1 n=1 Tax=Steinernema hermaphroditum TaxID=289476 RepID=A0AA39I6R8_9BILA|nr:hypothetical protein QR680_013807 [Steinernema hermaphroditum]